MLRGPKFLAGILHLQQQQQLHVHPWLHPQGVRQIPAGMCRDSVPPQLLQTRSLPRRTHLLSMLLAQRQGGRVAPLALKAAAISAHRVCTRGTRRKAVPTNSSGTTCSTCSTGQAKGHKDARLLLLARPKAELGQGQARARDH